MGEQRTVLHVFVASASDVAEEREIARRELLALNEMLSDRLGVHLEPFHWELDSQPGVGETQERVNLELDRADLVVLILWRRLGTPTPRAPSGVAEEFERALARRRESGSDPGVPEIFVYHSMRPVPADLSDEDVDQWIGARKFRKRTWQDVQPIEYPDPQAFGPLLRKHVTKWLVARCVPPSADPLARSAATLAVDWTEYLRIVEAQNSRLDMPGLSGTSVRQLALDRVYVRLRVLGADRGHPEAKGPATEKPEQGIEALLHAPLTALVGEPGAGKTTILRYVALQLARHHLGMDSEARGELGFLGDVVPIPVLFPYGELADALRERKLLDRKRIRPKDWVEILLEHLEAHKAGIDAEQLEAWLEGGRLLLMLDGLDEVTGGPARERLAGFTADFVEANRRDDGAGARVIATCRSRAWGEGARFSGFEQARLLDLDDVAIESFLGRWSAAVCGLAPEDRPEEHPACAELLTGLRDSILATEGVRRIATNPQMLTMLAVVYYARKRLPEQRSLLYQQCVEHLIESRPELLADYGGTKAARRHLRTLALAMQEARDAQGRARDALDRDAAVALLAARLHPHTPDEECRERARDLLHALEVATGLLASADRELRFHHRTFQEFLVAEALADSPDPGTALGERVLDPAWVEVAALVAGVLAEGGDERTAEYLRAIAGGEEGAIEERATRAPAVALCLRDLEPWGLPADTLEPVRAWLREVVGVLEDPEQRTPLKTRIAVAEALGRVRDPRLSEDRRWIRIPEGPFWRGSKQFENEGPEGEVFVSEFFLQRWPVTVGEFREFVGFGRGYLDRNLWEDEGWAWRERAEVAEPDDWREQLAKPSNHPVVGISWWEAGAYCRWVTRAKPMPSPGLEARLPREAEWEKAARGASASSRGKLPRTVYPWGNTWNPERLNSAHHLSRVGGTTPVGCYPDGNSPFEAWDMAGNVWEWCMDWHADRYERKNEQDPAGPPRGSVRVLRGGSWRNAVPHILCVSYRNWIEPSGRSDFVGFRVVAAPPRA